jgi:hypothetical protein
MQSQVTRFVLRIESGERQGEQVPLSEGVLQVGRRPECGLVLKDGSVSGKHAELRVAGERVELVDLGSTNGTRVSGTKIEQAFLSHGDALLFGNVRATLHDAALAGAAPAPLHVAPAEVAVAPGALERVSAEKVSRAEAGSKRSWLLIVLLAVVAAGAVAYSKFLRPSATGGVVVQVPTRPGNLLPDGSFEEGSGEWMAAEAAPVAFLRERAFARSGEVGLGTTLDGASDDWSLARSGEITLHARRALVCNAALRVEGSAFGRIGVELASSTEAAPPFFAWAPARRGGDAWEEIELAFDVPAGYDRARLAVAGQGSGAVAADDVSALEREPLGGAAKFNEYELAVLGTPGSSALFVRSGQPLLSGFDLSSWTRSGLAGWAEGRLEARAGPRGFELAFAGAPPDAVLSFHAVRPADATAASGWVATTGAEGYASYGGDFAREGVRSLLLGRGTELVRIGFTGPVGVEGTLQPGGMAFRVKLSGLESCELQLAFSEERAEAAMLADRAGDAERARNLGRALGTWTELLDRFPFERKLVAQATEARARLIQGGLNQVDELRREMERARFFLLPELFRNGRERALALARQYQGSEVEAEARKTAELCAVALAELTAGGRSDDVLRLQGVLDALDPSLAPKLTEHVRKALADPSARTGVTGNEGGTVDRDGKGD